MRNFAFLALLAAVYSLWLHATVAMIPARPEPPQALSRPIRVENARTGQPTVIRVLRVAVAE